MTQIIAFCGLNCGQCGIEHHFLNRAEWPEYGCEKITRSIGFVPDARKNLEELRQARVS